MTAPVLDLAGELRPLQEADPTLRPLRRLAEGVDHHYRLYDGVLYRVLDIGDGVVVPTALEQ